VVLPWSMWPIVPMFTWGFVRSNFFLPMAPGLLEDRPARPAGPARSGGRDRTADTAIMSRLLYH
jgi:hypothetical protein